MKRIASTFLLFALFLQVAAQSATDKSITEICTCVKNIDQKLSEDARTEKAMGCMSYVMEKNLTELKKEYGIKTDNLTIAAQEIGAKVGAKLLMCPEILPYLMKYSNLEQESNADINTDTLKLNPKVCESFTSGKFKCLDTYVNNKAVPNPNGNAFSEYKDGFLFDYGQDKEYSTKWTVRRISGCEWEQTLVETSDPNLGMFLKKGDKITVKAIGSTKEGNLWTQTKFIGLELLVLMQKIK